MLSQVVPQLFGADYDVSEAYDQAGFAALDHNAKQTRTLSHGC
jgi:hypothetical protein